MDRDKMGLPYRPFLYTLDQISDLLQLPMSKLSGMIHYDGRTVGIHHPDNLVARNLMPDGQTPEWRVEELELIRFMKMRGFRTMYRPDRRR